jgi:hypothetical protein
VPTVRAERILAADPTSTALLLAGPTAMELWPGLTRTADLGSHVEADATIPAFRAERPVRVSVRALPPRRTPTAFVTRFSFSGAGLPTTTGVLTLTHEPGAGRASATSALLRLDWSARSGSGRLLDRVVAGRAMRDMAEQFLANLATAAEERATAA